jgi:hypothetical protein
MSLLANVNQPNANGYYFALDSTPENPVVDAPAFVATGGAGVGPDGMFTAQADGVPAGNDVFNIATSANVLQWSMGISGTSGPSNAGNNLTFFSYDNSGAFLAGPMSITRATGGVNIFNGLTANQVICTGAFSADSVLIDGVNAQKSQTAFAASGELVNSTSAIPLGIATTVLASFTVPVTGLYLLSADAQVAVDAVNGCAVGPADSLSLNVDFDMTVALKPYSMPNTGANGLSYQLSGCSVALLTAATPYQLKFQTLNVSGTMAFPGGISAQMKLVALCS